MIKKKLKLKSGSATPNTVFVGTLSEEDIKEIIEIKMKDLNACDEAAARKIIEGSARSMGVKVA